MPGPETTILLVEDNPDDADLVRIAMEETGFTSTLDVVQDGAEALRYLHGEGQWAGHGRPDLVLLDLNLPGVDGREVLRVVKSDPSLCTIPVVVMTTSVDDNDVTASYQMHANAFVSKPTGFDELIDTLSAIGAFWLHVARLPGS